MEHQHIDKYKNDLIQTLEKLIRIQSEKGEASEQAPFGPGPLEALEKFLAEGERLGFRTGRDGGYAGWVEFGPEDAPMVAAVCHLDVVPAQGWPEAYEPQITDEIIVGRGSMDDKGPAVAVLYAMKSLLDEKVDTPCKIRLIVGCDEESGSACMKHYSESQEIPVAAFTADADFPVIHGEKGHCGFRLHYEDQAERNGDFILKSVQSGSRANVIPGETTVTYIREDGSEESVETIGKMGHASMPQYAKNAIQYALADAYQRNKQDPFLIDFMKVLGTGYDGEGLGIKGADEASGPLTMNVGIINYELGEGDITIDIRYPVSWNFEDIMAKVESSIEGTGFTVENAGDSVPLYRPIDDPLVETLMTVYKDCTGRDDKAVVIGGGTYARSLPNTLAFGPCFPEDENLCHQKGEYITINTLLTGAEIYRAALLALAQKYGQ